MKQENYTETNRRLWNKRTNIHYESSFYGVDAFLQGEEILNSIELDLLGEVNGKTILHLQCHFGMDTLALARRGASVTGIDLSDEAIKKADELKEKMGMQAEFICCNVYDTLQHIHKKYDIVFTSYGVIGWLPDLDRWAEVISKSLKPGGIFIMAEFHPFVWMFDNAFKKIEYAYFNRESIVENEEATYADKLAVIPDNISVTWNHALSEVITALSKPGLTVESFLEFDYSPYNCFNNTVEIERNKFQILGLEGKLPMVYALKAVKKE